MILANRDFYLVPFTLECFDQIFERDRISSRVGCPAGRTGKPGHGMEEVESSNLSRSTSFFKPGPSTDKSDATAASFSQP
jgi:hypothetical protein